MFPPVRLASLVFTLFLFNSAGCGAESLFQPSVRSPHLGEIIYCLMPDRFYCGDPSNNRGGSSSTNPNVNGFDPSNQNFFHGGDLKGVTDKLDYLRDLGATAIWMSPIFRNRTVQEFGPGKPPKAGYHGYWVLDFTNVDPHFGSKADYGRLISSAKDRGMGIIMDVVVNHTAHVIQPKNGVREYQYKFSKPYRDTNGKPFDDRDYINRKDFPKLDPEISFPIPPTFATEADRHIKVPDWLNDPTVYHNRGEASSSGESALYGSISGLDDLFTEQLRVVRGMTAIYANWIREFDIAGFRVDTVKHVNSEFWQSFIPSVLQVAQQCGRKDFWIIGEVYSLDPAFISEYVHRAAMPSVLDFGFQHAAVGFASGVDAPGKMAELYSEDSYYTTPTTNAYSLATFLGNHDMGRIGRFLSDDATGASSGELLARDILAHALMLFTRGIPVIYYGDEQGFTGKGGDVAAREDMFATRVAEYAGEERIGGGDPAAAAFNEQHPLYRAIRKMISVRRENRTLERGIQIVRHADSKPGIFAVVRVDPEDREEMLALFNNASETKSANIRVYSSNGAWEPVYDSDGEVGRFRAIADDELTVTLGPVSCLLLRNSRPLEPTQNPIGELHLEAVRTSEIDGRWEVKAEPTSDQVIAVAFGVRKKGESDFKYLGTADSPPYRVLPTWEETPDSPDLEFEAVARDLFGREVTAVCVWHRRAARSETDR
jgi:glycosidase